MKKGYTNQQLQTPGIDAIKPAYPEDFTNPFASGAKVLAMTTIRKMMKAADLASIVKWQLGEHKSATKWLNRLEKGGWLDGKGAKANIDQVLQKGQKFPAPNNVNKGNPATRYHLKGQFVVRDDKTEDILHVSGKDYIPKEMP